MSTALLDKREARIRRMFGHIAPTYDLLNHLLSLNIDRWWRWRTTQLAPPPTDAPLLDVCTGTGDLAIGARTRGAEVTGLDFSPEMLARARRKRSDIEWVQGDALALPFEDASFDAATVGFGVRNVDDLDLGLRELRRVLKRGGRVGILEITTPRGVLAPFYRLWFDRVVPLLGKVLPGGAAYTYLPASVKRFPDAERLAELLRATGFGDVRFRLLGGTIVALHTGVAG